jgi:hypothetical protein
MKRYGMPGPRSDELTTTLAAASIAETSEGQIN